jgi:hypothetical protein
MGDLVTADVSLQPTRNRATHTRDHDETPFRKDLRAAQRLIGGNNALHGMAKMLDVGQAAMPLGQATFVGMIEGRGRKYIHAGFLNVYAEKRLHSRYAGKSVTEGLCPVKILILAGR